MRAAALFIVFFAVLTLSPAAQAGYPCLTPDATGYPSEIDENGNFSLLVSIDGNYRYYLYWRGERVYFGNGQMTVQLSVACMIGSSELRIVPVNCYNDEYFPGEWSTTVSGETSAPKISVTLDKTIVEGQKKLKGVVTWDFGLGSSSWNAEAHLLPGITAAGQTYGGYQVWPQAPVTTRTGTSEFLIDPPANTQQLTVSAFAASCSGTMTTETAVECSACDGTSSGDPVYFNDGNTRIDDRDPLPPIAGVSLSRTYNSDEQTAPLFGRGWTTFFDRRLTIASSTGENVVSILTETNERVTFRGTGTTYRQTWPKSRVTTGTLSYDSGTATYAYRAGGSTQSAVFRASDGRLTELRDIATGHAALLAYDAQGLPSTVTDSWNGVQWVLTTDATARRVTSIAVSSRPDLVWTYQYDAAGNLETVLAPGSSAWRTYEYAGDRMTASRDAAGNLIESHTYDANGYAITSTGPADEITNIEYGLVSPNPDERITRVTEANGAVTDYVLQPSGGSWRAVRVVGGCSSCGTRDVTRVRDGDGRTSRQQEADGYISTTAYENGRIASQQLHLKPAGCDPESDPNRCRLDVDALAAATLEATGATTTTSYAYADPLWPDKPTAITNASVLNSSGNRTRSYAYHSVTGEPTIATVSGWTGSPAALTERSTTTSFYGDGGVTAPAFTPGGAFNSAWLSLPQPSLRKAIDGPRTDVQDVMQFVYYPIDSSVPAALRGRLAAAKNAAGHLTRFENYDVFGNVTRSVDANGVASETTYDILGRPQTQTLKGVAGCDTSVDPLCATDLVTTRTYSLAAGSLQREQRPDAGVTAYTYDARGRVLTVSRGPSASDLRERVETSYDTGSGMKSLERVLAFEGSTWVEKKRESYAYNSYRQVQTVTHADTSTVAYAYDSASRLASVRDENHTAPNTFYEYDAAGRLSRVQQTLAGASADKVTTEYGYDLHGNLTSVTDPNGNLTGYVYDDFGHMLSQESPVTGTTTYQYDAGGNLTSTIDANAAATARTHDALGRVLTAVSARAGKTTESITWTYDDATAGRFAVGRLATMSDPAGVTSYSYERRGLLREEARTFAGTTEAYTTTFTWNEDGERESIGYPSGLKVQYGHDFAGRQVSAATTSGTVLVSSAQYLPFGPAKSIVYGNGTEQTMQYDSRYRLTQNKLATATGTLVQHDYTLDAAGNITGITDALDAGYSRTFGYDDLNRLTTADTGVALWHNASYAYDAMGNLLSAKIGNPELTPLAKQTYFRYAGTTPKIAEVRETALPDDFSTELDVPRKGLTTLAAGYESIEYDDAGNELSYMATRAYSARNLMESVTDSGETPADLHRLDYKYDGRGVRVTRSESQRTGTSPTRYFIYSPELQLLSATRDDLPNAWGARIRTNAVPSIKHDFVWFAGRPLAQLSLDFTDGPHWYFTDHLGTPTLQTNNTATIVWHAEYEPYGDIWQLRAPIAPEEGAVPVIDQPLRFPGQEAAMRWEGTEERYNVFRWYRAGWGRYTQSDPVGLEEGPNLYLYVRARPTVLVDPYGLAACKQCDECPDGKWVNGDPKFPSPNAASIGVIFGGAIFSAEWVCPSAGSKSPRVRVKVKCWFLGPMVGGGAGVGGAIGTAPQTCGCNSKDLLGKAWGFTSSVGPFGLDVGDCSTAVNAYENTYTFSVMKSFGAGAALTKCTTTAKEIIK